jgi:hypothetical protein
MWLLFLNCLLFFTTVFKDLKLWNDQILELQQKDQLCKKEAENFVELFKKIDSLNEQLIYLHRICPSLISQAQALSATQILAKKIVMEQNYIQTFSIRYLSKSK